MLNFKYNNEDKEDGVLMFLDDKIIELKKKLDELVAQNAPCEDIYKISQELDGYIAKYYKEKGAWKHLKTNNR